MLLVARLVTFHLLPAAERQPTRIGPSHRAPGGPCSAARPKMRRSLVAQQAATGIEGPQGMPGAAVVGDGAIIVPAGSSAHSNWSYEHARLPRSGARVRHPPCPTRGRDPSRSRANRTCSRSMACPGVAPDPRNQAPLLFKMPPTISSLTKPARPEPSLPRKCTVLLPLVCGSHPPPSLPCWPLCAALPSRMSLNLGCPFAARIVPSPCNQSQSG